MAVKTTHQKYFAILALGFLMLSSQVYAQEAIWQEHYGGQYNEGGYACSPSDNGGCYAVGSTYSWGNGDYDIYVLKLDSLGEIIWGKTFGGVLADFGRDIQTTLDGGCVIVGSTLSSGAGKEDLLVMGISASGDSLWSKTFGGANSDEGWSIRNTSDNNLILCGTTSSSGAGYSDLWLLKITQAGDSIWSHAFGGIGGESGFSVRETSDGYIAVGSTGTFGEGYSSIYAVKTSVSGDSLWAKAFGGPKADYGYAVEISALGDYVIAGATGSYGLGYNDAYLVAVSPLGDFLWEKTFGGTKDDRAYAICNSPSGDLVVCGTTESSGAGGVDIYYLRVDPFGGLVTSKTFGGSMADYGRGATINQQGNILLAGYSYSYSAGGSDLYLLNLTADVTTDVDELPSATIPESFSLDQNYPNPFNGTTRIRFSLSTRTTVSLSIYNVLGQQVKGWEAITRGAGVFEVSWDGKDESGDEVASGIYFALLQSRDYTSSRKMIYLK